MEIILKLEGVCGERILYERLKNCRFSVWMIFSSPAPDFLSRRTGYQRCPRRYQRSCASAVRMLSPVVFDSLCNRRGSRSVHVISTDSGSIVLSAILDRVRAKAGCLRPREKLFFRWTDWRNEAEKRDVSVNAITLIKCTRLTPTLDSDALVGIVVIFWSNRGTVSSVRLFKILLSILMYLFQLSSRDSWQRIREFSISPLRSLIARPLELDPREEWQGYLSLYHVHIFFSIFSPWLALELKETTNERPLVFSWLEWIRNHERRFFFIESIAGRVSKQCRKREFYVAMIDNAHIPTLNMESVSCEGSNGDFSRVVYRTAYQLTRAKIR